MVVLRQPTRHPSTRDNHEWSSSFGVPGEILVRVFPRTPRVNRLKIRTKNILGFSSVAPSWPFLLYLESQKVAEGPDRSEYLWRVERPPDPNTPFTVLFLIPKNTDVVPYYRWPGSLPTSLLFLRPNRRDVSLSGTGQSEIYKYPWIKNTETFKR